MDSSGHTMSATEGADRVAARGVAHRSGKSDDYEDTDASPYTCESCGGHDFLVVTEWDSHTLIRMVLPCVCGEYDIAAEREVLIRTSHKRVARLDSGHRSEEDEEAEFEDEQVDEDTDQEEVDCQVTCLACEEAAELTAWETKDEEEEVEDLEAIVEVRCSNCEHEVEFGYSHLGGGRIWPVESADFNPWKTFPAARFVEHWRRRGWLRPKRR